MRKIPYIIIAILIVIIFLMRVFWPAPEDMSEYIKIGSTEYILLSQRVDTVYKIVTKEVPVYTPGPVTHVPVEIPVDVDTLSILKNYFAKNVYMDTIKLDSVGYVSIKDTIAENKIKSRSVFYNYRIPTVYDVTVVKDLPKNQFYLGGGMNFDKTDIINSAYIGALFKTKQDKVFGLNVGASTGEDKVKPYIGGSMYWKIKLKK